jgi:hypothetical protein
MQVLVDPLDVEQVLNPGFEVTVYLRIADPPFDKGEVHLTVARASPAIATAWVGALGKVAKRAFDTAPAGDEARTAAPSEPTIRITGIRVRRNMR